jgi:magnesium transporter
VGTIGANEVGSSEDHRGSKALADNTMALETAGEHIVERIPIARGDECAGAVLARLSSQTFDVVDVIYVVDDLGGLRGLVPLPNLLVMPQDRRMGDVVTVWPPTVKPDEDQELVVGLAVEHHLTAIPVVDALGRLLGVVPAQALMAILRREHIEDLHRLAGIQGENAQARLAIEAPPTRRARDRLPWLLVGFVGSFFATFVMSRFEHLLEARLAVAFFIPGIVYLADAIGTQTEAIAVRGLSLSRASLRDLLAGELRTGSLIGVVLGALSFPGVFLAFGDVWLALAVALALLAAGMTATTIGLLFPWVLAYAGKDPAFGSGPVATIIQDVLSLLIYFMLVRVLL